MQADVLSQVMLMPQVRPIAVSYGTDICSLYYFPCLSLCLCCFPNLNVNNNPTTQQWNEVAAGGGRLAINITVVMSYSVVVVESQLYYILKIPLVVRKLLINCSHMFATKLVYIYSENIRSGFLFSLHLHPANHNRFSIRREREKMNFRFCVSGKNFPKCSLAWN